LCDLGDGIRQSIIVADSGAVRPAEQLRLALAQDPAERVVGPDDPALEGHRGHADGGVLEDTLESLDLVLEQLGAALGGRLPLGCRPVRCGGGHTDQLADDVLQGRGLGEVRRRAELEGPERERFLVESAEHHHASARRAGEHLR
jgi:hypothetical protein